MSAGGDLAAELADLSHDAADGVACAVDGVAPQAVVRPRSIDAVKEVVRRCEARGLAVLPRGNGTRAHIGLPPARYDVALSTSAMTAVRQHNAADMTATVEAGITLEALDAQLAAADQWLPIDAARPQTTTVGGLIGADASGGLRLSHGRVRDYLIGVRAVVGEALAARGGGQVVKNVAGYDLGKLMIGSFGTLGIVVEATFKVLPRAAADVTIVAVVPRVAAGMESATALLDGALAPWSVDVVDAAAAAAVGLPHAAHLIVRFGGETAEVEQQLHRLAALIEGAQLVDATVTSRLRDFSLDGPGPVCCRISLPAQSLAAALAAFEAEAAVFGLEAMVHAHAGSGVARLRLRGDDAALATLPAYVGWLRFCARQQGGYVIVEQVPLALKAAVGVWGPAPVPPHLLRRVKQALDPRSTFSPGRFVDGI